MGIRLEGGVDYYWPPCTLVDCDAVGTHLDLIFQNRIGGQALGYFGLGATYQSYTLQNDDRTVAEGDSWGFDLVAGTRYSSRTALRPFGEIRWTAMDNINNQWAFAFGAVVPLGR